MDDNHIQGRVNSTVHLGLYYKDELASAMTFSKRSKLSGKLQSNIDEWELSRFCNKKNECIPGAASKLLKYFITTYNPHTIVSFSCNDISDGNVYKKLGFETDYKINQSYWYVENNSLKRYHRSAFTKKDIIRKHICENVDLSESEMMKNSNYFRIYDTGTTKWILTI